MKNKKRRRIDRSETFDEFLASGGLLAETEDAALKEIIADQIKVAMKDERAQQDGDGNADENEPPPARPSA